MLPILQTSGSPYKPIEDGSSIDTSRVTNDSSLDFEEMQWCEEVQYTDNAPQTAVDSFKINENQDSREASRSDTAEIAKYLERDDDGASEQETSRHILDSFGIPFEETPFATIKTSTECQDFDVEVIKDDSMFTSFQKGGANNTSSTVSCTSFETSREDRSQANDTLYNSAGNLTMESFGFPIVPPPPPQPRTTPASQAKKIIKLSHCNDTLTSKSMPTEAKSDGRSQSVCFEIQSPPTSTRSVMSMPCLRKPIGTQVSGLVETEDDDTEHRMQILDVTPVEMSDEELKRILFPTPKKSKDCFSRHYESKTDHLVSTKVTDQSVGTPTKPRFFHETAFEAVESSIEYQDESSTPKGKQATFSRAFLGKPSAARRRRKSKTSPTSVDCNDNALFCGVDLAWKEFERDWEKSVFGFMDVVDDKVVKCAYVVGCNDNRGGVYEKEQTEAKHELKRSARELMNSLESSLDISFSDDKE